MSPWRRAAWSPGGSTAWTGGVLGARGVLPPGLTRRLTAYLTERDMPLSEREVGRRPPKFAYPPQLLVVDGGKGQLAVAERVLHDLGLTDEIPVASLAKRFEDHY